MMHYARTMTSSVLRFSFSRMYSKASDIPETIVRKKLNLF